MYFCKPISIGMKKDHLQKNSGYHNSNELSVLIKEKLIKELEIISRQKQEYVNKIELLITQEKAILAKLRTFILTQPLKAISTHEQITIPSHHKVSPNINEENYDIILDMTGNSLKFRKDPEKHTQLKGANLKGIGARRIEILKYLLENPMRYISIENASTLPNQIEFISSNTLAKTIAILRKALGQETPKGPYILTEKTFESAKCIYRLNPQWNYLVI